MQHFENITELLIRHFRQELNPEESAYLQDWLNQDEKNRQFFNEINNKEWLLAELKMCGEEKNIDLQDAWEKMKVMGWESAQSARVVRMRRIKYVIGAAAAVLLLLMGTYLLRQLNKAPEVPVIVKDVKQDAKPSSQHAYLTLDNGETIILDSLQNGLLATQGNTKVLKYSDGVLRYSHEKNNNQQLIYNKVTVPKGSDVVYLQLSDGSKVWLNAESSIRYPVAFQEDERKVEITGEAYFEVAKSLKIKFIVSKGDMNVVVLGTRFNINTYDNEDNIKVTLLEGSVKVQLAKSERTIKPGQQAVLNNSKIDVLTDVDVGAVMAWKEGKFVFNNTNIQTIMRQIARWYNFDSAQYMGDEVKTWGFTGEISRYNKASTVLQMLERTGGGNFKIEGKKIIISK